MKSYALNRWTWFALGRQLTPSPNSDEPRWVSGCAKTHPTLQVSYLARFAYGAMFMGAFELLGASQP
jgi:hypothetical protein